MRPQETQHLPRSGRPRQPYAARQSSRPTLGLTLRRWNSGRSAASPWIAQTRHPQPVANPAGRSMVAAAPFADVPARQPVTNHQTDDARSARGTTARPGNTDRRDDPACHAAQAASRSVPARYSRAYRRSRSTRSALERPTTWQCRSLSAAPCRARRTTRCQV